MCFSHRAIIWFIFLLISFIRRKDAKKSRNNNCLATFYLLLLNFWQLVRGGQFDAVFDGGAGGFHDALAAVCQAVGVLVELAQHVLKGVLKLRILLAEQGHAVYHVLSGVDYDVYIVQLGLLHPGGADKS